MNNLYLVLEKTKENRKAKLIYLSSVYEKAQEFYDLCTKEYRHVYLAREKLPLNFDVCKEEIYLEWYVF